IWIRIEDDHSSVLVRRRLECIQVAKIKALITQRRAETESSEMVRHCPLLLINFDIWLPGSCAHYTSGGQTGVTSASIALHHAPGGGAVDDGTGLPSTVLGSINSTRVPSGSKRLACRLPFLPMFMVFGRL